MRLDHAVIVVPDLDQACADYGKLGFTVTPGGDHADGRTHNALIAFADGSYLELIAFRPGVVAAGHPWWRFAAGGLADWALLVDGLEARVRALHSAGYPWEEPREGGRLRPDGVRLVWKATPPAPERGLPFLIEDVTARALRVPGGAATEHLNGSLGLAAVVVAGPDLEALVHEFATLLDVEPGSPERDPLLSTEVVSLPCGPVRIVLTSAGDPHGARAPALYALVVRAKSGAADWLDLHLTHRARIRFEAG